MKRLALSVLAVLAITAGFTLSGLGSANAANGGNVYCVNGESVVGVWVDVKDGRDGWAIRSGNGSSQRWSFDTQNKPYQLFVGCGGSPASWRTNNSTYGFSTTWSNLNCWPGPVDRYGEGGKYAPIGHCVRQ